MTRPALPYKYIHALQTVLDLNKKHSELVTRYFHIRHIFLIQMKYRLQSMYNHMVGPRHLSLPFIPYSLLREQCISEAKN